MEEIGGVQKIKVHRVLLVNFKSLPTPHKYSYKAKQNTKELVKYHLDLLERLIEYSVGHERKNDRQ